MKQKDLAKELGVTQQWLSNVINGSTPSDELAERLATLTRTKPSVFFGQAARRKKAVMKFLNGKA